MGANLRQVYNELLFDAVAECIGRMVGDYVKAEREGRAKDAITKLYGMISLLQLYSLLYWSPASETNALAGGFRDLATDRNIIGFAPTIAALAAVAGKMAADKVIVETSGEALGRRAAERVAKYLIYKLAGRQPPSDLARWVSNNPWAEKLVDEILSKGLPITHVLSPPFVAPAKREVKRAKSLNEAIMKSVVTDALPLIKSWFDNPRISDLAFADAYTRKIADYYKSLTPPKNIVKNAAALRNKIEELQELIDTMARSVAEGAVSREKAAKLICSKMHGIAWNAAQFMFQFPGLFRVVVLRKKGGKLYDREVNVGEIVHKDINEILRRVRQAQSA